MKRFNGCPMRKQLALLLSVLMIFGMLSALPVAADGVLSYTLSDGKATITGCTVATANYTIPETVDGYPIIGLAEGFIKNNTSVKTLTIPKTVTQIAKNCFRGRCPQTVIFAEGSNPTLNGYTFYLSTNVKKVVLPPAATTLTDCMFRSSSLQEVVLPPALEKINYEAFRECKKLSGVSIPETVTYIGDNAFFSDTGLCEDIYLSENIAYIGGQAFLNCYSLTKMTIMSATCTIGTSAFSQCSAPLYLYGRKNSTAAQYCKTAGSYPIYVCATDDDHMWETTWTTALAPTKYSYGLEVCTCQMCGRTQKRSVAKLVDSKPGRPYVSGNDFVNSFSDVREDAWYRAAVGFAVANGLLKGTAETAFSPDVSMNRAMFVTVLWRMEQEAAAASNAPVFSDLMPGAYYETAVRWAAGANLVNGVGNGKFDPNGKITREQAATLLYRYAAYMGWDISKTAALDGFSDGNTVSAYAQTGVGYAVGTGLLQGKGDRIDPLGIASRAEIATILYRMLYTEEA